VRGIEILGNSRRASGGGIILVVERGDEDVMMDMGGMVDRCMDAMNAMMGGGMMGMSPSMLFVVLLALFLVWLVGLGVVGALIFWGVRRLSRPHA
jgi:hypothetical protein